MTSSAMRIDRSATAKVLESGNFGALATIIPSSSIDKPPRRDIDWLWNQIGKYQGTETRQDFHVAFLSSFTLNPLEAPLGICMALRGMRLKAEFVPYQQWEAVLHKPDASLRAETQLVQLLLHLEQELPLVTQDLAAATEIAQQVDDFAARLRSGIEAFRRASRLPLVLNSMIPMNRGLGHFMDANQRESRISAVNRLNALITEMSGEFENTYVYDYANTVADTGRDQWFDPVNADHTLSPISAQAVNVLAHDLGRLYHAMIRPRAKVLVVDLDNTLWGGIVGEDGPLALKVSGDHPGNAYRNFQKLIKAVRETGIVLAIASKNNLDDVLEAFQTHTDMPLKWDDFTIKKVNWSRKSQNLIEIADEIGVGLESLVFADDNPVECEEVRTALPEVTVVHLGTEPSRYCERLLSESHLLALRLTHEDAIRVKSYDAEQGRKKLLGSATSEDEFLSSLDLELHIGAPTPGEYERVVQLINKTNQFNLTTRRYTMADILEFLESDNIELSVAKARDKFGDYGLIGVQILKKIDSSSYEIDTFLMSCRVLGRKIESGILTYLKKSALECGASRLRGVYLPTKKNEVVKNFYLDAGFRRTDHDEIFEADLDAANLEAYPRFMQVHKIGRK